MHTMPESAPGPTVTVTLPASPGVMKGYAYMLFVAALFMWVVLFLFLGALGAPMTFGLFLTLGNTSLIVSAVLTVRQFLRDQTAP